MKYKMKQEACSCYQERTQFKENNLRLRDFRAVARVSKKGVNESVKGYYKGYQSGAADA